MGEGTPNQPDPSLLAAELKRQAVLSFQRSDHCYNYAQACNLVAIGAGFAAGVAAAGGITGPWMAAVAALPGVLLMISRTINLSGRFRWHIRRAVKIQGLHDRLVYQGAAVAEISKAYSRLSKRIIEEYPPVSDSEPGKNPRD